LIVEDQPFVGMVASDILREAGFDTLHAFDAADAAALLDQHPEIEVVVTDADLSGSAGGIELARRLANQRPQLELIVTVAGTHLSQSDVPDRVRLLHKPYASRDLRKLVGVKALAFA
jgi:CheY-like chemotaxis protein